MICPNCGRRNSAGATFCSRCRQRLPLAAKLNGNHRRAAMVEPRGGGGSAAIVLGVALLAGFLFIGGAAAIYLSNPPSDSGNGTDISFASNTPSLPIFVQPTATPSPSPTYILLPSESPSLSPSGSVIVTPSPSVTVTPPGGPTPTPRPTKTPTTRPTATPGPAQVVARFDWNQQGASLEVKFTDKSSGNPTQWQWDFGDNSPPSPEQSQQNPTHTFPDYGPYTVTLVVIGPGGTDTKPKPINVQAPPCNDTGGPPGCIPTPSPTVPPPPTATPSPTETATPIVVPTATETPAP